ncbi:hypothetical protein L2E82_48058 [Cichorium intybus]|uniref:Uncharacterized protein n=1 Tax=Cichorium intybus TaxID=13427 RepID=A0ACB8YXQ4_CICIN|nr:hypothetical protein L2E82_48058 [Cichorium intybus]
MDQLLIGVSVRVVNRNWANLFIQVDVKYESNFVRARCLKNRCRKCPVSTPGYDSRKRTLSLTKSGVLAGISSPLADAGGPSPYTIRDSKLDWCSHTSLINCRKEVYICVKQFSCAKLKFLVFSFSLPYKELM